MSQQMEQGSGPTKPGAQREMLSSAPSEPDRRETVDGQEMLVYVLQPQDSPVGAETTVWVNADTGYPRRTESENVTIEYHSYGDVDPITKPNMDCGEMGSGSGFGS